MASNTVPAPINILASGFFEGVDGNWSTFNVSLGSNGQPVRLLPATRLTSTVVVASSSCGASASPNCSSLRGGTFDLLASRSWQENAVFTVENEPVLDSIQFPADFGSDTIAVPVPNQKPTSLDGQLIASGNTTANLLELGLLGLSPASNSLQNQPQIPSYLSNLRSANLIPGIGYGFTAGASYHNTPGSLVLGGYDTSRYQSNNLAFTFGPDGIGELQIGVQQIVYNDNTSDSQQPLLTGGGILALVDSTVPDLWLHPDVCAAFEKAFNLTFTPNNQRYVIDDGSRAAALRNNASVTITISNSADSGATADIVLPYSAFDLYLEPPMVSTATRYFPIRQASKGAAQYTLGRTFLQEAYVLFNFEEKNFNVYQAYFPPGQEHILPITAAKSTGSSGSGPSSTSTAGAGPSSTGVTITHPSNGGGLPNSAIAGITIAVLAVAAILAGIAIWLMFKKKKQKKRDRQISELQDNSERKDYHAGAVGNSPEQHAQGHALKPSVTVSEVDGIPVGRQTHNDTGVYHDVPAELDEGAPRTEMESSAPVSPQRSPRLGNVPTYIEMPSPAYSRQSTGLPSPSAEDTQSISQALSQQQFHSTRQSPVPSPADEDTSQLGSPQFGSASAFQSPRFGHPSPEGQLPPFNLNHSPAQSPVDISPPRLSPGPDFHPTH